MNDDLVIRMLLAIKDLDFTKRELDDACDFIKHCSTTFCISDKGKLDSYINASLKYEHIRE